MQFEPWMIFMCACGIISIEIPPPLQWRHNGHDGVSNHQPHDGLLHRLFRRKSTKISKLRVTGLCAGNSPVTGEFPSQRASNAENASVWRRHHDIHDYSITLEMYTWHVFLSFGSGWFSHTLKSYLYGTGANIMIAPVPVKQLWNTWVKYHFNLQKVIIWPNKAQLNRAHV